MNDGKQQSTFLFHDYETFGTHPALDRPAQFAAIRTDNEFNVIGEPEVFYCKPADDYLPQPGAVLITGITPAGSTGERRKRSHVLPARIHSLFTVPKTCILATTMCVSTTKSHATFFIVISTILTPGAGSMITRAGIYWMLCVPVMPYARKE